MQTDFQLLELVWAPDVFLKGEAPLVRIPLMRFHLRFQRALSTYSILILVAN